MPVTCALTIREDPLLPISIGALCYSCFTILLILSSSILLTQAETGLQQKARLLLFIDAFLMFAVATAHLVVVLVYSAIWDRLQHDPTVEDQMLASRLQTLIIFLPNVNAVCSVRPRYHLESDAALGSQCQNISRQCVQSLPHSQFDDIASVASYTVGLIAAPIAYQVNGCYGQMIGVTFSLFNNVSAISFIAYRPWQHRRLFQKQCKHHGTWTEIERMLYIIVESGALYCLAWVIYAVGQFTPVVRLNDVMLTAIIHLSGIYPTLVICLVHREPRRSGSSVPPVSTLEFTSLQVACSDESCPPVVTISR
ncbi:hypothetical protein DENSPDRAFT_346457 [Dentipellis sp. KUC8613]|nr:hypothetical protein DENSPDRAFT_346457 [Dentipellis sp. KUC8613]